MMNITTTATAIADIHSGASTHHHDQFIEPVNLRTINVIASSPENPIPLALLDVFLLLILINA
jgi:hypothetical protein